MSTPQITDFDAQTGESTTRNMTPEEIATLPTTPLDSE